MAHIRSTICTISMMTAVALAIVALAPSVADAKGPQSVAPVARELIPAVVNISTSQKVKTRTGRPLPKVPKGSPFEDLFEDFFQDDDGRSARKVASLGSGFVIDGKEGLVVTNNHVIENADEIIINFSDGRKLTVDKVLGIDKKTDLALLKVTPDRPLPDVKFGPSDAIDVGDWVLAIGNPFGLGGSVSVGIISAKQRDIRTGPYDDYLQTDAAINKGNSGGPLFNMSGEVIGVNTAIISPTGGSIGIGFAVPSDTASLVIDQLRRYGETRRGWLGVNIQTVTDELAESLGVPANQGALIARVTEGGPAAKSGLEAGDVVLTFNGKTVRSMRVLPRLVAQTEDGAKVPVEVVRKGKRLTLNVTVGRLDETEDNGKKAKDEADEDTDVEVPEGAILGLMLQPADDALIAKFKLRDGTKGLVVTGIEKGSAAERKGLAEGEILVEAGRDNVALTSRKVLAEQIARAKAAGRRNLLIRIDKGDGTIRFEAFPLR